MSSLGYVGKPPSQASDVADQAYVASVAQSSLNQSQIDAVITAGYAPYATKDYVDQQDTLNANKAYIDAGDATRLSLTQVDVNNGVPSLDSNGRVDVARVNLPSVQSWPKAFWSPSAYNSSTITASTTETTVYTCSIADPGFTYFPLVFGSVDVTTNTAGEHAVIRVRVGSSSGPIVAMGHGLSETSYSTVAITPFFGVIPPVGPTFDAVGSGFNSEVPYGKRQDFTFTHTAARYAYVIVDMCVLGGTTVAGCTYGGTAMSQLAKVALNNHSSAGSLVRYGIFDNTGGTRTIDVYLHDHVHVTANSVSYVGAKSVGPSLISYGTNANNTSISMAVPCQPGQVVVQCFGADQTLPLWTPSGGTTRYNNSSRSGAYYIAALDINTATTATTFSASATNISNNAGIATLLTGLPADPGSSVLNGASTLYVTIGRSGSSSTVTATNLRPSLSVTAIPSAAAS